MPFKRSAPGVDPIDVTATGEYPTGTVAPRQVDEAVVHALITQLHSPDPARRSEATARLQECADLLAPLVPTLLAAPEPSVRISTLTALASTTHPDLESWLIAVLDDDPEVNVCAAAVDLLGEVGTGAARASLERLPDRFPGHPYILFAIRVALERLSDG